MILSETLVDMKIAEMLKQQKALLDEGLDVNDDGDIIKVKKEWNESILADGGVSYYKLNNKWYRVSVCGGENDVVLKYWFKNALGVKVSVSAATLKEAQAVVNDIYGVSKDGKGKYTVSASKN